MQVVILPAAEAANTINNQTYDHENNSDAKHDSQPALKAEAAGLVRLAAALEVEDDVAARAQISRHWAAGGRVTESDQVQVTSRCSLNALCC